MNRTLGAIASTFLVASLATAQVQPPDADALARSADAFELVPGVLVDRAGGAIYLMSPAGEVEAIDLASGILRWSADEAAKPLALYGDYLVAQAVDPEPGLEVVLLDVRQGGAPEANLSVDLPAGLAGGVDDRLGRSFLVRSVVRDGDLLLSWQATERYARPVAPEPGEELETSVTEAFRLDTAAERAVAVAPARLAADEPTLPATVQAWQASTEGASAVRRVGGVLAATEIGNRRRQITLKRWAATTGAPLLDIELFTGEFVLEAPSTDGRHLLITERVEPGGPREYAWSIFSLATGELTGRIDHHQSFGHFFVDESQQVVVFELWPYVRRVDGELQSEPRSLHALQLGSSARVWERPLRDTAFRGQVPP